MYNDKNIDLLDRLDNVTDWSLNYLWHKNCYSTFTSENKINRLKVQCTPSNRGSDEKDKPKKSPEVPFHLLTGISVYFVKWLERLVTSEISQHSTFLIEFLVIPTCWSE